MPYGGGIFLPSETSYKDPNRFKDVLQAEGNKEAAYLSSMDQFYEQLSEMKREFNVTSAQKDRFFEENLAFGREKLQWQSSENASDRSLQRWSVGEQTSSQRFSSSQAAGASRYATEMGYASNMARLALDKEAQSENISQNQFLRGLYTNQERRAEQGFQTGMDRVGGSGRSGRSSPFNQNYAGDFSGNYYSPFSGESLSDYLNQ